MVEITEDELAMLQPNGDYEDIIDYWINLIQDDLGTITDPEGVKASIKRMRKMDMFKYYSLDDTGIFAYIIGDDYVNGKVLSELIFYIKPQYRGDLKLVKRYIQRAEKIALDTCCSRVTIGANIGHKDQSFLKLLRRWGYNNDSVSKSIRG